MLGAREPGGWAVAFLQLLISGVSLGCIYALIALGFVLIYKATETVNFAQGDLMMLGAFAGLALMELAQLPFIVAAVLAIAAMAAFGVLLERVVIRPILGQPQFTVVMLTIGIGYMARGLMSMLPSYGTDTHALPAPYKGQVWNAGALVLSVEQVVVVVVTVVLCALLFAMFRFSRVGIAMQASSQNQLAAYYMGIPVRRLNGVVWGLSAAVATIAGLLLAPFTFVHVNMGFIGLKAFPAAVVGGFGSLPGAIVGGLIIGVIEAMAGFYLPEGFKDIAAYVVVLVMLVLKPNGLFGGASRKKV
jgi:branched-chain amino acid transport system permease protein